MPRGGARIGAGRPKASGKKKPSQAPVTQALAGGQGTVAEHPAAVLPKTESRNVEIKENPLDYMLRVINDPAIDAGRRDRMAVAAAPYVHGKVGEGGKREKVQASATKASGGKFAPAEAPRLVSSR